MSAEQEMSDEASYHRKITPHADFVCFRSKNAVVRMDTDHIRAEAKELTPLGQMELMKKVIASVPTRTG